MNGIVRVLRSCEFHNNARTFGIAEATRLGRSDRLHTRPARTRPATRRNKACRHLGAQCMGLLKVEWGRAALAKVLNAYLWNEFQQFNYRRTRSPNRSFPSQSKQ